MLIVILAALTWIIVRENVHGLKRTKESRKNVSRFFLDFEKNV